MGLGKRGMHHAKKGARRRFGSGDFGEHTLHDEADLNCHLNYIHYNPVKHGLVKRPADFGHIRAFIAMYRWGYMILIGAVGWSTSLI